MDQCFPEQSVLSAREALTRAVSGRTTRERSVEGVLRGTAGAGEYEMEDAAERAAESCDD
jgi:hypothetical protein